MCSGHGSVGVGLFKYHVKPLSPTSLPHAPVTLIRQSASGLCLLFNPDLALDSLMAQAISANLIVNISSPPGRSPSSDTCWLVRKLQGEGQLCGNKGGNERKQHKFQVTWVLVYLRSKLNISLLIRYILGKIPHSCLCTFKYSWKKQSLWQIPSTCWGYRKKGRKILGKVQLDRRIVNNKRPKWEGLWQSDSGAREEQVQVAGRSFLGPPLKDP
jgi:hypothetical protein